MSSTRSGVVSALVMAFVAIGCHGSELSGPWPQDAADVHDEDGKHLVGDATPADAQPDGEPDAGADGAPEDALPDAPDEPDLPTTPDATADTDHEDAEPDLPGTPDVQPDAAPDVTPDVPVVVEPVTFPLACTTHADCAHGCATGQCTGGVCRFPAPQASCVQVDASGELGTCVAPMAPSPDGGCLVCNPQRDPEGWSAVLLDTGFEQDLGPLAPVGPTGKAAWHVSTTRAATGLRSLHFGVPGAGSYDTGARAHGIVATDLIPVAPGVTPVLSFTVWMETEKTKNYDFLRVTAEPVGGTPIEIWHSNAIGGSTDDAFVPVRVVLDGLSGKTFRLVFEFDTVDDLINAYEGVYLDDLRLGTGCCSVDADCDDADPCTTDLCPGEGLACEHLPVAGCCSADSDCDDGNPCTADTCPESGGACTHTPIPGCCLADKDCGDGDPCTRDLCGAGGQCHHQPLCCDTSADCDDGDACTVGTCTEGQCVYDNVCCLSNADCNDGEVCTVDLCVEGQCLHQPAQLPGCCFPDILVETFDVGALDAWTFSTPDNGVGWHHYQGALAQSAPGALYYGNPANMNFNSGSANSGTALGPPIDLPSDVAISLTFSIYFDGETSLNYDNVWLDVLTGAETITVAPKSLFTAKAWKTVTVDLSYLAGQTIRFRWNFSSVDSLTNDGLGVLVDDFALTTSCEPKGCATTSQCASSASCLAGTCSAGVCTYVSSCCSSDDECDDGKACTKDVCSAGKCQFQPIANCCDTALDCDDKNPCTLDTCSGPGGACGHTPIPGCCVTDAQCNDGDACTLDACVDNVCQHQNTCCSSDAECDDGDDVCTVDKCVGSVCQFAPTGAPGCCDTQPLYWDFESPVDLTLDNSSSYCEWQIIDLGEATSGAYVLYYGDPFWLDYDCGHNWGTATTGPISLLPGASYTLSFQLLADIESSASYDKLNLHAISGGKTIALWDKTKMSSLFGWSQVKVDLSAFAGKTFQLRFTFDTVDGTANLGFGVLIDDLRIDSPCTAKTCTSVSQCSDGLTGTTDQCQAGFCTWTF